jgi:hypothetical protein
MLTEYFEESLVLMKRILCWDLKDILFVPLNINKKKQKHPINLSEQGWKSAPASLICLNNFSLKKKYNLKSA